ncbi:MAG: 3-isopropylmalate dehydratase small subunit [Fimbriimonadales bacterium]
MEPFSTHTGNIAVLSLDDIDTDRIIPARFLSRISRSGYGELLFADVRGDEFPLDQPAAQGASILVTGSNFGSGSSREHAVWAIQQAGFTAVIAKQTETDGAFSDIFRQNSSNCGLLLIGLPEADWKELVDAGSGVEATIDLSSQTVTQAENQFMFDIAPANKRAIEQGLDLIGNTLLSADAIEDYERDRGPFVPPA